ncbi:exopolysaccharide biosynthesis protein [Bosea sp. 2YAB26]|uniref:exopolysaccharide biosynthesis protein n=1 Tax=Bosea sp. 2YAB26 TaxID=3237478 RepID=UPI003F90F678
MMLREFPLARPVRIMPLPDAVPPPPDDGPVSMLRAVGATALRHRVKLAGWIVICLAAAFLYARATPPTYTAATTLLLEPRRQVLTTAREVVAPSTLDLNRADSELQVVRSERLLSTVFAALRLADHPEFQSRRPSAIQRLWRDLSGVTPLSEALASKPGEEPVAPHGGAELGPDPSRVAFENFARRFSARRVGQSYAIEIAYDSADPNLPARVANAAASAYLLQSVAFKADAARSGGEFLQARLNSLSAQVDAARLAVEAGELPSSSTPDADAKIIGAAQTPLGPSAPRRGLILAFGGVFGLLSGLFVGAIASALDRKIWRGQDILRETGLPCLAAISKFDSRDGAQHASAQEMASLVASEGSQAYVAGIRDLRTAIEIARPADRTGGNFVIAIGSWEHGEEARMLAMNLGQLMHLGGRSVSILSANLDAFLTELPDAARPSTMVDAIAENLPPERVAFLLFDGMRLLPIRSAIPQLNRFADLREPRAARLVAHAKQLGDVLIDLPPFDDSADALALATHADCVILVAAEGSTTFEDLNDASEKLRRGGTNVLGVVLDRCQP